MADPDIDALALKAMRVIDDILSHPAKAKDPDYRAVGRIASATLSTWATIRQADNNMEMMRIAAARELAGDNGKEFKRFYLGSGQP